MKQHQPQEVQEKDSNNFFPSPQTTTKKDYTAHRSLEVIPALLTWATLIGMVVFSIFVPVYVAIFIIAFDIYWIHRTVFISYYSIKAYRRLKNEQTIDWLARCKGVSNLKKYKKEIEDRIIANWEILSHTSSREQKKALSTILSQDKKLIQEVEDFNQEDMVPWEDIYHVVMLPTATEEAASIDPALKALQESRYPNEKIIILLATEEREDPVKRKAKVDFLRQKYAGVFRDFIVSTHKVAAGEMKCKASNTTYAAKKLQKYLDDKGIDYKNVILSNFDCESVAHPEYFGALTYAYITEPKRLQRAYQPIPLYHNNLWETNAFVRVIVTSSSFWHMFQSTRREMVTFSSHAEAFDTLVKVGFWPVNMISEDSIIYWKGYAYFDGDYAVKPLYVPVSMDAVLAKTYWKTIVNQYKQKRRWAYGIENFPIIMRAIWPNKKIFTSEKLRIAFEMLEGHHSWATSALMLALLGWLPLVLGGSDFNELTLAHNLPVVTRYLMTIAMCGLIISIALSFLLLPPRPEHLSRKRYIFMFTQWFLVPITAPLLGAMPAIESQTRILFKRYFTEFWVTEKVVKKSTK